MDLTSILFLDIETVAGQASYEDLSPAMQKLWQQKAKVIYRTDEPPEPSESYPEKAGIFAEFGKIICISVGLISIDKEGQMTLRIKSYAGEDEAKLLQEFSDLLENNKRIKNLCGHNIKEFDIPYTCRRMMINQIALPKMLDIAGKKPWELNYMLDTLVQWKFGDFKNYTKLSLLTEIFGIPTPKDDIDGSEVNGVYWRDRDIKRIAVYCEKDVVATAQLVLRFQRKDLIPDENISFAELNL